MKKEIEIYKGNIEEKTIKEVKYAANYPSIEGKIEQPVKYIISGVHKDNFYLKGGNGEQVTISDNLSYSTPDFFEKLKLIFSLVTNIFNPEYWQTNVRKLNYIKPNQIEQFKKTVNEYNAIALEYAKIDGQKITEKKVKVIEATPENLAMLIQKIEENKSKNWLIFFFFSIKRNL